MHWRLVGMVKDIFVIREWPNFFSGRNLKWLFSVKIVILETRKNYLICREL